MISIRQNLVHAANVVHWQVRAALGKSLSFRHPLALRATHRTGFAASLALLASAAMAPARAGSEAVLYSFTNGTDGSGPYAGVTADNAGNLYGATQLGGNGGGLGIVFKLSRTGVLTTLHAFTGGADGEIPQGTPVLRGNALFGTTQANLINGSGSAGGAIYEVTTSGMETTLASLTGKLGNRYGFGPAAGLLRIGNEYYGVTAFGPQTANGAVFQINAAGKMKLLHVFNSYSEGIVPFGTLVADASGNLYGTTDTGGAFGDGTIFKVTPQGTATVLYNFAGGSDGSAPVDGLVFDSQGNLYGTTTAGGTYNNGTVFELTASGTEKVIYTFLGEPDGASPSSPLVINSNGQLVGTTTAGGKLDAGTVFAVTPAGVETQLYSFTGGADGGSPYSGLLINKAGHYIGTTFAGGAKNYGTVYEIIP